MNEILYSIFIEPFKGDGFEKLLGVVMISLLTVLLGIVGFLCFLVVDSAFLPDMAGRAKVIGHNYTDEYYQTIINTDGTSQMYYYPESYSLAFEMDGFQSSKSVSKRVYERIRDGEIRKVTYRHGRFTGGLYITSVE